MLTYLERLLWLQGVPTFRVEEVRLGYVPAAAALLVVGFGLSLTWLIASRRRNLFEPATGLQAFLLGTALMFLACSWEKTADYFFIAFLFVFFTVLLLALMNFKGLENDSLLKLRISRGQLLGYLITASAAFVAYWVSASWVL